MNRFVICSIALCLTACLAQPTPEPTIIPSKPYTIKAADNPYTPQPNDKNLRQAGVVLTSINLVQRFDLDPTQVEVDIQGSMPGTCNELRVNINLPNDNYQILMDVYSIVLPVQNCDNVFHEFKASVLLGVYSSGRFTVWVNQGRIGDFISP
jgi:hypothetical protein